MRMAAVSSVCRTAKCCQSQPAHFAPFSTTRHSPGLIIVDQDLDIGRSIEELLLIWAATDIVEWLDKIGYVPI